MNFWELLYIYTFLIIDMSLMFCDFSKLRFERFIKFQTYLFEKRAFITYKYKAQVSKYLVYIMNFIMQM
jgi:hypothetical protein